MNDKPIPSPSTDLQQIIDSARRLGVEIDEAEALQWLTAMSAVQPDEDITFDLRSGVYGHKVAMLDFSPEDLAHFRELGRLVELKDLPGSVETALALSGSAAQSKIQSYPGDADYFERVNIRAETREQACQILSDLIRNKALSTAQGPTYQLMEVRFGTCPQDLLLDDHLLPAGNSISWTPEAVRAGVIEAALPDGSPLKIRWEEVARDPGWTKLDWVVADPVRKKLANASNMLDVTWEAPDGTITPLDGYLDPYFQEVYLEAESIPIFSKLARHVSADAMDHYVDQLQKEVDKYLTRDLNYGKVAKRMYNIFRLNGQYEEAVFLRELFDEPATMLYQVWSLIRTIDECCQVGSPIKIDQVKGQADQLTLAAVEVLEGAEEAEIVRSLLRLRSSLDDQKSGRERTARVETARAEVINLVNNFFYEKLMALPSIRQYIESFQGKP